MGTTVSFSDVLTALECAADELHSYVNRSTGRVITLSDEDLQLAQEIPVPELPAWQQKPVAEAREVLGSTDWLGLPSKFNIHEWEIMNRFGQSLSPEEGGAEVANAIRGSGAFRVFKATVCRLGIEQAWYAYKQHALEDIARDWLAQHGLESV